jgi:hypothetical protein
MNKMMMAVAACALAAGMAYSHVNVGAASEVPPTTEEVVGVPADQVFNVTSARAEDPRVETDWDGTIRHWEDEARQAGANYAIFLVLGDPNHQMGIWSSDTHSWKAIAADLEITEENLVKAMAESSEYRAMVLCFEQQTLIATCLENLIYRPWYEHIFNVSQQTPADKR